MSTIVAQKISQAGLIPVYTAAAADDILVNTGIEYIHVKNGSGVTTEIKVVPVVTSVVDPLLGVLVKETAVLTLLAGEEGFLGPFEVDAFNSTAGTVSITYSPAITSVSLAGLYT
jgi:hypothetical protein|tara:strand:- start:801 stop:1145 length:345 start_codon:yes stop_codon:yes gene_type:complete